VRSVCFIMYGVYEHTAILHLSVVLSYLCDKYV